MNKYADMGSNRDKRWPEWLCSAERMRLARAYQRCGRKASYPTPKAADAKVKQLKGTVRSYACKVCGKWHLASKKKRLTKPQAVVFPQHVAAAMGGK